MKTICKITPSAKLKRFRKYEIENKEFMGREYIELKVSKRIGKRAFCALICRLKNEISLFLCPNKYHEIIKQCGVEVFDEHRILSLLTLNFAVKMLNHNKSTAKSMSLCLVDKQLEYKSSIHRLVTLCRSVKIMGCERLDEFSTLCDDIFEKTGAEPSICRSNAKFDMIILPKTHTLIINRQKYTVTKGCFDLGEDNLLALCMISVYGTVAMPDITPILQMNDKTVGLYDISLKSESKTVIRK